MRSRRNPFRTARALVAALILPSATGCQPADLLNALVPDDVYERTRDVSYGPGARHRLDLYRPEPGTAAPKAPIAIYVYGGSWRSGERGYYPFVGEALTSLGFVAVIPDYRLYPEVRFPAFMADVARAIAWARDHAESIGGDPDRIVLMGHSAGAHIVTLLALDRRHLDDAGVPPAAVRGIVGLAGPYAFDPLGYDRTRPIFADADPVLTRPINLATEAAEAPTMLLLHGEDDETVEPWNTQKFEQAVRQSGGEVVARLYPDLGHIGLVVSLAAPFRGRDDVFADVATFLARMTATDPDKSGARITEYETEGEG